MASSIEKKHRNEWENDENNINSEFRSIPIKKSVCRYCKKEFECGRGLGGHIKIHFQDRRKTNFTRKNKSKKRTTHLQLSSATPPPHSRSIISYREKGKKKRNGGSDEVNDLSKSLSGFGWKGHKKRKCIEPAPKVMIITSADFDDSDDDGDSFVMERLRRYGFNSSAHRIICTRRYMCKTCNVVLPTYHAVLCHTNDSCSSLNNVGDDENKGVVAVAEGGEEAEGEYNGGNEENEIGEEQEGGDGDDDEKGKEKDEIMAQFDLNKMPPEEED